MKREKLCPLNCSKCPFSKLINAEFMHLPKEDQYLLREKAIDCAEKLFDHPKISLRKRQLAKQAIMSIFGDRDKHLERLLSRES